jgi:hypothetical protein
MKVIVDRLNGTLSIRLEGSDGTRKVAIASDVYAELDRFGRLQRLDILRPLSPEIRQVLPKLAVQFHLPALAHLDPRLLMGRNN